MNLVTRLFAISLLSILGMFVLPFSASEDKVFAEVETGIDMGEKGGSV